MPGVRSQRSRWLETAAATSWPNSATASSSLSKPTAGAIPDTLADHRSLVCSPATLTVRRGGQQENSSGTAAAVAIKESPSCGRCERRTNRFHQIQLTVQYKLEEVEYVIKTGFCYDL